MGRTQFHFTLSWWNKSSNTSIIILFTQMEKRIAQGSKFSHQKAVFKTNTDRCKTMSLCFQKSLKYGIYRFTSRRVGMVSIPIYVLTSYPDKIWIWLVEAVFIPLDLPLWKQLSLVFDRALLQEKLNFKAVWSRFLDKSMGFQTLFPFCSFKLSCEFSTISLLFDLNRCRCF